MLTAQIQPDYSVAPKESTLPSLPEKGAIIRLIACGLCGSDLEKFVHHKAQPGTVLGHEVVGIIESLAEGHDTGFQVGDRIVTAHHTPCHACHYCLNGSESMCSTFKSSNLSPGGFSEHIALTQEHLKQTAFKVPEHISDEAASAVEPLACALRAIDRLEMKVGQSVLVVGLGFIGLMASQIFHKAGVQTFGLDLSDERIELANRNLWVDKALNANNTQALDHTLHTMTPLGKVDAVFLTVVNRHTIQEAFERVRNGGKILLFASAPPDTNIDPSMLYYREISVVTSYSPSVQHLANAAQMIFDKRIDVEALVTHHFPLSAISDAMSLYRSGQAIKVLITP